MANIKKARERPRTPKKAVQQQVFLDSYRQHGNISLACEAAGVARARHSEWMRDPEYQERFAEVSETAADRLTEEARRRAVDGIAEPVLYQGALCFEPAAGGKRGRQIVIRRYSDNLLMFLIKKARPEYRDTWKGEIRHSGAVSRGPDLSQLSDDQLQQLQTLFRLTDGSSSSPTEGIADGSAGGAGEESEAED